MNNIDVGLCGIFLSGAYSGGPGQLHLYPQEPGSHSREDCHVQWVPMWVSFPTVWDRERGGSLPDSIALHCLRWHATLYFQGQQTWNPS